GAGVTGFGLASARWRGTGRAAWARTSGRVTTGRPGEATRPAVTAEKAGRCNGCATTGTERCSDEGGDASGRPMSAGAPKNADMATTPKMDPAISAAARTRAQVLLMFLPRSVDTPNKGSIGTGEQDLRGSCG